MNYQDALRFVLRHEGGFVHHPRDPGGATNMGITQAVYDDWRRAQRAEERSVKALTPGEAAQIYEQRYWSVSRAHLLPDPCDAIQFDAAVQHGPSWAIRLLQRALRVGDDGIPGPITMGAVNQAVPALLARDMLLERVDYYWSLFIQDPQRLRDFGRGWQSRIRDLKALTLG